MERDERYEVNSQGSIVVGTPVTLTPSEKKNMIEKMFAINGWTYTLLEEVTSAHYYIELKNENLQIEKRFHLFHGNVRKEDPERNREEKKIQLGTENDPRQYFDDALILGFYVYENKNSLADTIVVAWPIEEGKNYPANPSLRVNMRTDVMPAKNAGYYVDKTTGKNLVVFRPEFIYHYIENYKDLHYGVADVSHPGESSGDGDSNNSLESERLSVGTNVLLYGVPGSGKSWTIEHEYCKKDTNVERLVFHPDYTYSDFIGQILPAVAEDGQVSYKFTPGPFTNILADAYTHPQKEYILVIEEINRGNAPAIFGEVFQLLDRKAEICNDDDGYPIGTSEYGITNANIAAIVYGDANHKVRIPSNLSIIGTMNTSDQNVFTLDTAFQRRWDMRLIENDFTNVDPTLADAEILDTTVTWKNFCTEINKIVVGNGARMTSAEDKRLGAYFVHLRDLKFNENMGDLKEYDALCKKERNSTLTDDEKTQIVIIREAMKQNRKFPEKVIKYLWDDAFKFNREVIFETTEYQSLEQVIRAFMYAKGIERFKVFKDNVRDAFDDTEE